MKPRLVEKQNIELLNDKSNFETFNIVLIYVKYEGEDDDLYLLKLRTLGHGIDNYTQLQWVRYSLDDQYLEIVPDRIAIKFLSKVRTYKILPDGINVPCGAKGNRK